VFAASSLDGAAREKYAAMEAGGGAVAAPSQKVLEKVKRVDPGLKAIALSRQGKRDKYT
jgi:hypothetical protein